MEVNANKRSLKVSEKSEEDEDRNFSETFALTKAKTDDVRRIPKKK